MKRALAFLLVVSLAWVGIIILPGLLGSAVAPVPVNAPTHVGQPGQWNTPNIQHASEQAFHATGGCRGWNNVVVQCSGNYAIWFTASDEMWVRYINAYVGHGWAGNWSGCERVPAIASACQYWLTVDPAWFNWVFTAYPNGVAVIWNIPSGALIGFW